jgi:2,4-dienoyl-CoA reductase-like NADH-dependent reductase (Old Yellow Enzyme family)
VTAEPPFARVASLKTPDAFRSYLTRAHIDLPFDDTLAPPAASPLAWPFEADGIRMGNRFCILPMEGWDGTRDGSPSDLTTRRWRHFGESGAKLIWGGEAVAVRHDGRANPHQLLLTPDTLVSIAALREALVSAHRERFGANADADLFVGLQLTHSGRFSRPDEQGRPAPLTAYAHPLLDRRFTPGVCLTDEDLDRLVEQFIGAARRAYDAGFAFVDVKHCHGYLAHELLGARSRPGRYGGSFENRTRFLTSIVDGIRAEVPGLRIGVRISAFDTVPFVKSEAGPGQPEVPTSGYGFGFGVLPVDEAEEDMGRALQDARALLRVLEARDVRWVCISAGTPYYNPHVLRPAMFPPVDGYTPPEDPLKGVARHVSATAMLKAEFPNLVFVGSGYSYLQEWLPHVAQHTVRQGMTDFVGLGRMVLSYPGLPADVLAGRPLRRKAICRTFSDCTTGPRLGLVSGCYPLDDFYAARPDAARLAAEKSRKRGRA